MWAPREIWEIPVIEESKEKLENWETLGPGDPREQ